MSEKALSIISQEEAQPITPGPWYPSLPVGPQPLSVVKLCLHGQFLGVQASPQALPLPSSAEISWALSKPMVIFIILLTIEFLFVLLLLLLFILSATTALGHSWFTGWWDVTATRSYSRSLWGNDPVMWTLGDCHVLSTGGTSPFLKFSLCPYQSAGPDWESHTQRHVAAQAWGCASNQQRLPSLWNNCEP